MNFSYTYDPNGNMLTGTEQRYFIYALGRLVAQVSNNGTTSTTQYAHTDSLGSVDALTIKSGTSYSLAESASFDEYGQPRLSNWAKGTPPLAKATLGYTGHDMDTEYGLINMTDSSGANRYARRAAR